MKYFYSAKTGGLYNSAVNGENIPSDAVEISESDYQNMKGQPIFADATGRPLLVSLSVSEIKAGRWEIIKAERDRRTQAGGYKVGQKWFHSDQFSRGQQLGLVLLGANIPTNLQWKTMDGSFVTMTQTLAQQILAAGAASDQAIFAAAETHKAAMEASADPSAYDFSGGWPATFAG